MSLSALVVDPSADTRKTALASLEWRPALFKECHGAASSGEALEHLRTHRVDLIVLDLDGAGAGKLLAELRENEGLKCVPVVGLSWEGDAQRVEELLVRGIDSFVAKPLYREVLERELRHLAGAGKRRTGLGRR